MNFSCNGCGGCCHGPISLTMREALSDNIGDMPLVVTFVVTDVRNVPVEKGRDNYSLAMKKFTRDVSGFYDKTISSRKIVVHPQIISLLPVSAKCPNLDGDNKCSIYNDRPSVCRLYPFRIDTPISWMGIGLDRERNISFEGSSFKSCEGWDVGPAIFSRGMPTDDLIVSDFKGRSLDMSITRDLLKEFYFSVLKENADYLNKIDEYSLVNENSGRVIQIGFIEFCNFIKSRLVLKDEEVEHLKNRQFRSINNQLSVLKEKGVGVSDDEKLFINVYESHLKTFG